MKQQIFYSALTPDWSIKEQANNAMEKILDLLPLDSDCYLSFSLGEEKDKFSARCFMNSIWGPVAVFVKNKSFQSILRALEEEVRRKVFLIKPTASELVHEAAV